MTLVVDSDDEYNDCVKEIGHSVGRTVSKVVCPVFFLFLYFFFLKIRLFTWSMCACVTNFFFKFSMMMMMMFMDVIYNQTKSNRLALFYFRSLNGSLMNEWMNGWMVQVFQPSSLIDVLFFDPKQQTNKQAKNILRLL